MAQSVFDFVCKNSSFFCCYQILAGYFTLVAVALATAVRAAVAATVSACQLAVVVADGEQKGEGYDKDDYDLLHDAFLRFYVLRFCVFAFLRFKVSQL